MENSKQPAFPLNENYTKASGYPGIRQHSGISKREYFAGMIAQGICANPTAEIKPNASAIAKVAIEVADELLKQLGQ